MRGLVAGALAGAWAGLAAAQDVPAQTPDDVGGLRLSGFGTLGASRVHAPAGWGFRRDLTQSASDARWRTDVDSRLGVQANYALGERFELVGQVIARKRGTYSRDGDAVEWAYAGYRLNADWTLRAGRVNVDSFLMADYRNVGYGFPSARPPVDLYAVLPTTLDGVDLTRSWIQGDVQWRAKLAMGRASIGDVDAGEPGDVHRIVAFMGSREEGGLLLRASFARMRIDMNPPVEAMDGLLQLARLPMPAVAAQASLLFDRAGARGHWGTFTELGLRHELANWQWSAELVRMEADPLIRQTSAYVIVGRRWGGWTPFVGYGRTHDAMPALAVPDWQTALAPLLGTAAAAQAQELGSAATAAVNAARALQSTRLIGVRWDMHPQAALKLQWERVDIRSIGSSLWSRANGAPARAHVATVVVDFIF